MDGAGIDDAQRSGTVFNGRDELKNLSEGWPRSEMSNCFIQEATTGSSAQEPTSIHPRGRSAMTLSHQFGGPSSDA